MLVVRCLCKADCRRETTTILREDHLWYVEGYELVLPVTSGISYLRVQASWSITTVLVEAHCVNMRKAVASNGIKRRD